MILKKIFFQLIKPQTWHYQLPKKLLRVSLHFQFYLRCKNNDLSPTFGNVVKEVASCKMPFANLNPILLKYKRVRRVAGDSNMILITGAL